jgi:purine-binding chemotaxis protein CheW
MSKSLTASKKLMQNYLSELLTDSEEQEQLSPITADTEKSVLPNAHVQHEGNKSLEQLLKGVTAPINVPLEEKYQENKPLTTRKSKADAIIKKKKAYREGDFQAMFFDVAGLIIAVPLIELGGIHQIGKLNSLMGKPEWFKGVMLHREEKINVVDTALWVMPEKCDDKLIDSLKYQYIIMLNDSSWGLMAENLIDTVTLSQDEVKWQEPTNKRPWLAGLVKEKMCALLDVSALIKLLDEGNNIYQEK